jgi:hypothetical protein
MFKLLPTKKQWEKWTLPSKLTAVGAYIAVISIVLWAVDKHHSMQQQKHSEEIHEGELADQKEAFDSIKRDNETVLAAIKSLKTRMEVANRENKDSLIKRYPEGYCLFGISTKDVILPHKGILGRFSLDWSTARVDSTDKAVLKINLPDFRDYRYGVTMNSFVHIMPRKVGIESEALIVNDLGVYCEILSDTEDGLIAIMGFKEVK